MACGCGGNAQRQTFRTPAATPAAQAARQAAAQVGAGTSYEVVTASGQATGRRFSSLVAATNYARNINGSTRPVD